MYGCKDYSIILIRLKLIFKKSNLKIFNKSLLPFSLGYSRTPGYRKIFFYMGTVMVRRDKLELSLRDILWVSSGAMFYNNGEK